MGELSSATVSALQSFSAKRAVQGQVCMEFDFDIGCAHVFYVFKGGLLTGQDPASYDTADPLRLWVIQLGALTPVFRPLSMVLT